MAFFAEKVAKARMEGIVQDALTGNRLRKLRKAKGIMLGWVAKKIGVSDCYLVHLEKGRRHWTPYLVAAYLRAIGEEHRASLQYPAHYGTETSTK